MSDKIYHIQIELIGSKPGIWRRLLVEPELLLEEFHMIIQTTMGWTNSHLHQFIKSGKFFTLKEKGAEYWDKKNVVDYSAMTIADLLKKENDEIIYEYDFGDGWEHRIVLEEIVPAEEGKYYPVCIGGRMKCPPEDSGGIPGYLNILKILQQPDHKEYSEYKLWLGKDFDPKEFDKDQVNEFLSMDDFGCYDHDEDD